MSFSVMLRLVKTKSAFKQIASQFATNASFVFPLPKKQILFGSPEKIPLGHIHGVARVDEILPKPCLTKKSINLLNNKSNIKKYGGDNPRRISVYITI